MSWPRTHAAGEEQSQDSNLGWSDVPGCSALLYGCRVREGRAVVWAKQVSCSSQYRETGTRAYRAACTQPASRAVAAVQPWDPEGEGRGRRASQTSPEMAGPGSRRRLSQTDCGRRRELCAQFLSSVSPPWGARARAPGIERERRE